VLVEASQMADMEQQMMIMVCFDITAIINSKNKRLAVIKSVFLTLLIFRINV